MWAPKWDEEPSLPWCAAGEDACFLDMLSDRVPKVQKGVLRRLLALLAPRYLRVFENGITCSIEEVWLFAG